MPEPKTYNRKELFLRISEGDEAAFRACFDLWHHTIYTVALHYLKVHEAAEDVVQQVYIKLWEKRAQLRAVENPENYLFIICRNECLDTLRKLAANPSFTELMGELFEPAINGPDEEMIAKEVRTQLSSIIETLPEQQRQVWRLVREEGLSYKMAAEQLALSPVTVKSYLVKATQKIASQLKANHPDLYAFFIIWLLR